MDQSYVIRILHFRKFSSTTNGSFAKLPKRCEHFITKMQGFQRS